MSEHTFEIGDKVVLIDDDIVDAGPARREEMNIRQGNTYTVKKVIENEFREESEPAFLLQLDEIFIPHDTNQRHNAGYHWKIHSNHFIPANIYKPKMSLCKFLKETT